MTQPVDKTAIAAAFGRAANHYEQFADLQRLSGDRLLARVASRQVGELLDAGCGTGWYSRVWQSRGSRVVALDLSASMLAVCQQKQSAERFIEADIEAIPLTDNNHNLDTSPEFYSNIITTRTYQERLDTLDKVRGAGIKVCSGGILGLGESVTDRAGLLLQLANMPTPPESVPINMLVKVKGTPLADNDDVDPFDFIRTIAVARVMMPSSYVRLSAGREQMSEQTQAMCFMAGANSIFYGCKLLTTTNPEEDSDLRLFRKLGLNPQQTATALGDNEQQQHLTRQWVNADTANYYNAAV